MSTIHYQCLPFINLTLADWYTISQAREQVFIVEQNCPYLDSDGQDLQAWHVIGHDEKSTKLACYTRILPPDVHFQSGEFAIVKMPAIGRVLTVAEFRGRGLARELMDFSIVSSHKIYGEMPIYLSAQVYLLDFYQRLGFMLQGEPYLEDGIAHQDMVKANF